MSALCLPASFLISMEDIHRCRMYGQKPYILEIRRRTKILYAEVGEIYSPTNITFVGYVNGILQRKDEKF